MTSMDFSPYFFLSHCHPWYKCIQNFRILCWLEICIWLWLCTIWSYFNSQLSVKLFHMVSNQWSCYWKFKSTVKIESNEFDPLKHAHTHTQACFQLFNIRFTELWEYTESCQHDFWSQYLYLHRWSLKKSKTTQESH